MISTPVCGRLGHPWPRGTYSEKAHRAWLASFTPPLLSGWAFQELATTITACGSGGSCSLFRCAFVGKAPGRPGGFEEGEILVLRPSLESVATRYIPDPCVGRRSKYQFRLWTCQRPCSASRSRPGGAVTLDTAAMPFSRRANREWTRQGSNLHFRILAGVLPGARRMRRSHPLNDVST